MTRPYVSPIQISEYLLANGWERTADFEDLLEIWSINSLVRPEQLQVPTESALDKDYLISEAIRRLSEIYDEPEISVLNKIRENAENTFSIRVVHPDVEDGSIPIEDGIALSANAKDLLVAAANSAIARRSLHQGRLPVPVSELVKHARLGQTDRGSYIIHVFCRNFLIQDGPDRFAQASTRMLQSALSAIQEAIREYQDSNNPLVFERAISHGVSANLCDSLAKLAGKNRERTIHITLQSSSSGEMLPATRSQFEFPPESHAALRTAYDYYRQIYTLANIEVVGVIERLDRRFEREDGAIRISATLPNGVQRSISLQLSPDEYPAAIRAHEAKQLVRVTGDVVVSPRSANILEPRNFGIISNGELFDT